MIVETISSEDIVAAINAIEQAHMTVGEAVPGSADEAEDAEHWQTILEENAKAVLSALEHVSLPDGFVVRYRFYERHEKEIRIRPFVARETTDVDVVRAALEWHPPPDSSSALERMRANRDADLLYRRFEFADSALGVFHYWLAMQDIWASASWVHARVIAGKEHFAEIVASTDWQVERSVESYQPVVVRREDGANLALLIYSPLHRHSIALQQVEIQQDNAIVFAEPITVATGPRGYVA